MERDTLQVFRLDFINVAPVLLAQDNLADAGAFGGQYLLADATHRKDLAAQSDFARHGQAALHLPLRESRDQRCHHRNARARSVFGDSTFRHMDMDIQIAEQVFRNAEQGSMGVDVFQCQHGRFLHDIAQVAGQCQLAAFALAQTGLDKQNLAADGSPRQARHHAGIVVALIFVARIFGRPQVAVQVLRVDLRGQLLLRRFPIGQLAHQLGNLLVQFTDTALSRIGFDERLNRLLRQLHFLPVQSVDFGLFRYQVLRGYLDLFLLYVPAHFDQLHAVQQRLGNRIQVIRRRDEQHTAQVVVNVEVIVVERAVLLRVQHLQQGRRRIALKVVRHLVYLVQDEHRIRCPRFLYILQDPPAHGADVGPAVPSDFGLVIQAPQRHPHILPAQRLRDGTAQRSLPHSRRAIQAEYRRLHVFLQLQHGQMLDDAFLHLFQPVMIPVQHPAGMGQVEIIRRIRFPRQIDDGLQILHLHRIIGRLRVEALQLVKLLVEDPGNRFRPLLACGLLFQFLHVPLVRIASQFLLDRLDLLLQEIFLLLLVDVLLRLHLDGSLQLYHLELPVQESEQLIAPFLQIIHHQQHLLVGRIPQQAGACIVNQIERVVVVLDRMGHLPLPDFASGHQNLDHHFFYIRQHGLELPVGLGRRMLVQ